MDPADLSLPFDKYPPSLSEIYKIANAQDLLVKNCMRRRGLDWQEIVRPTEVVEYPNRRRYGLVEMQVAEEHGYHVPRGLLTVAEVDDQTIHREDGLTAAQQAAAYSKGGCYATDDVRELGDVGVDLDLFNKLNHDAAYQAMEVPSVAEALNAWRTCMRDSGFQYRDPYAAMSGDRWWTNDDTGPTEKEIAVAVADVKCKANTSLVGVWHAAEVEIQDAALKNHRRYFDKLFTAKQRQLELARAITQRADLR